MNVRLILVPSDLSPDSTRPLLAIGELARTLGASLCLVHVVLDLHLAPLGGPLVAGAAETGIREEMRQAQVRLDEQRLLLGTDVNATSVVLRSAEIARTVANYAKEIGADWIALSTHGRTGWRHLALGSVAEAILRHAEIPVLSFPRSKG